MKKISCFLLLLFCALSALLFSSCNNVDHPIAGHTYYKDFRHTKTLFGKNYKEAGQIEYMLFRTDGTVQVEFELYEDGAKTPYSESKYDHLKYKIDGNIITISYDNSTYWKSSMRGTEFRRCKYNSSNNTIESDDGVIYVYLL